MRTRAALLVCLAGSLVAGLGLGAGTAHAAHATRAAHASARQLEAARLSSISVPPVLAAALTRVEPSGARTRDALDRDGERRLDTLAFLAGIALLVIAAWWVARRHRVRHRLVRAHIGARPRAPPRPGALVVSS